MFSRTRKCNIIAVKFYAKVGNMKVEQVYGQVYVPKLKMRFDNFCTELKSRFQILFDIRVHGFYISQDVQNISFFKDIF